MFGSDVRARMLQNGCPDTPTKYKMYAMSAGVLSAAVKQY